MISLKIIPAALSAILFSMALSGCDTETDQAGTPEFEINQSIMVFSKTEGYRHNSIEQGIEAVKLLGQQHGVAVFATEDASYFNESDLARFDAVLFLNTTGTLFNEEQRDAFEAYIQNGGGFAGLHSAADTEYDWPWYGELVGAWFESHPRTQPAVVEIVNPDHISTRMLPAEWEKEDEWYNFLEIPEHVDILLELDTDSFEGSEHPGNHVIAWYHEFDGGRAFYTGMGHTVESFSDDLYLRHLWGGLEYVMDLEPTETDEQARN